MIYLKQKFTTNNLLKVKNKKSNGILMQFKKKFLLKIFNKNTYLIFIR